MVITRIERMRTRQPRYRIRFDEGEQLVLSEDLLIRFGLASGDTMTHAQLQEIRDASERDAAKQSAYHFLSFRPRSEHEITQYLVRKGFSKDRSAETTQEFRRLGLVNDETFAAMVVRDAVARGRSGPAAVRRKLLEKRVPREIADRLISEYFTDDVLTIRAIDLLTKRIERTRTRLKALDPAKRRARLYQYLCQRGFSSQTAIQALNSMDV